MIGKALVCALTMGNVIVHYPKQGILFSNFFSLICLHGISYLIILMDVNLAVLAESGLSKTADIFLKFYFLCHLVLINFCFFNYNIILLKGEVTSAML